MKITKTMIKAVLLFCRHQESFNPKDCQDFFDETDNTILDVINQVMKNHTTNALIVEETLKEFLKRGMA